MAEVDPDLLLNSLSACLSKDESLLGRFVDYLFKIPNIHKQILEQIDSSLNVEMVLDTDPKADPKTNSSSGIVVGELNETVNNLSDKVETLSKDQTN